MEVRLVSSTGVERRMPQELASLIGSADGFAWLDVPVIDEAAITLLSTALPIDGDIVQACAERTLVPKVEKRDDYLFLVVHSLDEDGHLLQLSQIICPDVLVTVHGPLTPGVDVELARRETNAVAANLEEGRLEVSAPIAVVQLIVTELAQGLEDLLATTAAKGGALDRRLREGETGNPEKFLDEVFSVRHGLVTIGNRAAQTRQACMTLLSLGQPLLEQEATAFEALSARFDRLTSLCDGEKEFLQGVLDFYESQVNTRMNIAMARLALIAAVTLPVTAIGGFFGMNTIVNSETDVLYTILILVLMVGLGGVMFLWAKRQGWW